MHPVSVAYAQAHSIELLEELLEWDEGVIERNNRPLARVVPEVPVQPSDALPARATGWPVLGMYKGQGWMARDFGEIPEGFEEYVK